MDNLIKRLESIESREQRAKLLKANISKKKKELEQLNNVTILDIDTLEGLSIGDKVVYRDVWDNACEGYVNYFASGSGGIQPTLGFMYIKAMTIGANIDLHNERAFPVILNCIGGLATHHRYGLPEKVKT